MTPEERFLRRVRKLDAAGKAALRASATRPHDPDVAAHDAFTAAYWREPKLPLSRDACRLVAALYFWHPKDRPGSDTGEEDEPNRKRVNLVDSLRLAVSRRKLGEDQTERLVNELLAASFAGLPGPLLTAMQRLAKANVTIDWPQLIRDLARWERPESNKETVQEAWANSWVQTGGSDAR